MHTKREKNNLKISSPIKVKYYNSNNEKNNKNDDVNVLWKCIQEEFCWFSPWKLTFINLYCFHFLVAFCVVQVPLVVYLSNSFFHSVDLEAWFHLMHSQVCPVFLHWVSVDLPVPYKQFQCLLHTFHSNLWFLHGKHYTSVTLTFAFANDRSTCFMVGILCKKLLANYMTEPDKTFVGFNFS